MQRRWLDGICHAFAFAPAPHSHIYNTCYFYKFFFVLVIPNDTNFFSRLHNLITITLTHIFINSVRARKKCFFFLNFLLSKFVFFHTFGRLKHSRPLYNLFLYINELEIKNHIQFWYKKNRYLHLFSLIDFINLSLIAFDTERWVRIEHSAIALEQSNEVELEHE